MFYDLAGTSGHVVVLEATSQKLPTQDYLDVSKAHSIRMATASG
jgi:hypothetical protein